jgi:hypothetical protein
MGRTAILRMTGLPAGASTWTSVAGSASMSSVAGTEVAAGAQADRKTASNVAIDNVKRNFIKSLLYIV